MSPLATIEREDRTAIVTINRPDKHNCVNAEVAEALRDCFDALAHDATVDAVILTGAGDKAFCTGLDLKQLATEGSALIPQVIFADTGWAGIGRRFFPKPLIAAINGYAIAGGLELVLSCDFAYAAAGARMGFNEATLGPIADAGGCFRLPHWVPLPFAKEMLLTGRLIDADEAFRVGLVNKVVPREQLLASCLEAARLISRNSPSAMTIMKSLMTETLDRPESEAWVVNDRYMHASFETEDFLEGPKAFVEGRHRTFHRPR